MLLLQGKIGVLISLSREKKYFQELLGYLDKFNTILLLNCLESNFCNIALEWSNEIVIYSKNIENKLSRMKPLSCESISRRDFPIHGFISVHFVSDYRMTHIGHMDTDLMCTSCEELDLEKRIFIIDKF